MVHLVITPPYTARMGTTIGLVHTKGVYRRTATEKIYTGVIKMVDSETKYYNAHEL